MGEAIAVLVCISLMVSETEQFISHTSLLVGLERSIYFVLKSKNTKIVIVGIPFLCFLYTLAINYWLLVMSYNFR